MGSRALVKQAPSRPRTGDAAIHPDPADSCRGFRAVTR